MVRKVRISTLSLYWPERYCTVEENVNRALAAVESSAAEKPDIVCLPEMYHALGVEDVDYQATAAAVPGRFTEPFSQLARAHGMYVIASVCELAADANLYISAVILDRHGEVAGIYRKTHLTVGEKSTFAAGNELPVFALDFGRVGIMTCRDLMFPEVARVLMLKGADLLFWPTMAWGPTDAYLDIALRSRAMDNQVYCATANFCRLPYLPGPGRGRAYIAAPEGSILADTGHRPGVATTTVDLDEGRDYWLRDPRYRTLKDSYVGDRRPELYGLIADTDLPADNWRIRDRTPSGGVDWEKDDPLQASSAEPDGT